MQPNFVIRRYSIHPGIGVARIGNSTLGVHLPHPPPEVPQPPKRPPEQGFFIGPEVPNPDFVPTPFGHYRDSQHNIRRQAARFRIYEYTYTYFAFEQALRGITRAPTVREITADEADIEWHVHLANAKSKDQNSMSVVNDPGEKTVGGVNHQVDVTGQIFGDQVQLGTLATDAKGRLMVLGGFGKSKSPSNAPLGSLFNALWYDDVSDGPVRATIKLHNSGAQPAVEPAWVLVGVPGFAHPVESIVTLYDLAYDRATQLPSPNTLVPPTQVSFTKDIYPLLRRPVLMQWVIAAAQMGHSGQASGNFLDLQRFALLKDNDPNPNSAAFQERQTVFNALRNPNGGGDDMPLLNGGLAVTPFQYQQMQKWSVGNFAADWTGAPPPVVPLDQLPAAQQPAALDKAGLITTVGGVFFPGIEACSVMADVNTYEKPLRIRQTLPPGTLTSGLSVPWQADYTACGTGWWPAGRPNDVTQDAINFYPWKPPGWQMADMVQNWAQLGFIAKQQINGQTVYVETERFAHPP